MGKAIEWNGTGWQGGENGKKLIISYLIHSGIIKFYRRYVDDTFVLIKSCDIPTVLAKFNSFDKNLQFTVDFWFWNRIETLHIHPRG